MREEDDEIIEHVYNALSKAPVTSGVLAYRLMVDRSKLVRILRILRKQGRAERISFVMNHGGTCVCWIKKSER